MRLNVCITSAAIEDAKQARMVDPSVDPSPVAFALARMGIRAKVGAGFVDLHRTGQEPVRCSLPEEIQRLLCEWDAYGQASPTNFDIEAPEWACQAADSLRRYKEVQNAVS